MIIGVVGAQGHVPLLMKGRRSADLFFRSAARLYGQEKPADLKNRSALHRLSYRLCPYEAREETIHEVYRFNCY